MYREIYLDNSATTRPYDEVNEFVFEINKYCYGNPSSLHTKGIEAERKINAARDIIAKTLVTDARQIIFTSGGTESNNIAIKGFLEANPRKGKHIITTKIEHPSVLEVCSHLEKTGYKIDYLNVGKDGIINLEELKSKITGDTALISIIMVNNETGAIQPVDDAVKIKNAINPGIVFHTDAVQAYGKFVINPAKSGVDLISVSSHKIHGPKGVGVLYYKNNIRLMPILYGGGQESKLRSGTENVSGICGFGMAADITCKNIGINMEKVFSIKKAFIDKLTLCDFKYRIISDEKASPYILNISFDGLKSEVLLHHLERRNIYVSTGSACSSRKKKQSHVLQSMGFPSYVTDGAIRFSFSASNTIEEIDETITALREIVPDIKYFGYKPAPRLDNKRELTGE